MFWYVLFLCIQLCYAKHIPAYELYVKAELANATGYRRELLLALHAMPHATAAQRRPLKLADADVYPISFAIPEEFIVPAVPAKAQLLSKVVPGVPETYVFKPNGDYVHDRDLEHLYHADLSRSLFALTNKKSGWDCMRHLEILARGSLPYMHDIEQCPPRTMAAYPKDVLKLLLRFPGLPDLRPDSLKTLNSTQAFDTLPAAFDRMLYLVTVSALLHYTRTHLSTTSMAEYLFRTMGVPHASKVLFISDWNEWPRGDYMCDTLLHGCKRLLGVNCVDFHKRLIDYQSYFSEKDLVDKRRGWWGYGFSHAHLFDDVPHAIDRSNLEERLANREFDIVIFGMGHRAYPPPLFDKVCQCYPPSRVAMVHGNDYPISAKEVLNYKNCTSYIFSRELYLGS
jgi:hypothetical protein